MVYRYRVIPFNLYKWAIGVIGLAILLLAVHLATTSYELEAKAGNMFLLVIVLPGLALMGLSWLLAARRLRAT